MRTLLKEIVIVCISIFVSYVFFVKGTRELFDMLYQGTSELIPVLFFVIFAGQSILIHLLIRYLVERKVSKIQMQIIWFIYIVVLVCLLFGRYKTGRKINLNIYEIFNFSMINVIQMVLNVVLFLPIGQMFAKRLSVKKMFIASLVIILSIETLQYITARGIFDIVDIILNICGIVIGYFVSRKR